MHAHSASLHDLLARAICVGYADDFIELALRIQQVIAVANRGVGRMREEVREPQRRFAQVRLAS
jgi:hypothetical protein